MPGTFLKPTSPHDRKTLGKYELLSKLSTGGMSEIFLATQKGLAGFRKIVVLKSILPNIRGQEEFVKMFLEEARITSSFNHPNIAQVFDLDTDDEHLFLVMEFVQGATLTEVTRASEQNAVGLPLGFALTVIRDTALALHYAHTFSDPRGRKQAIVHRDVSGKNIMVTYEGTTKLLDFGIAKALGAYRSDTTSIGMVKGTTGYMSPEQVLGEAVDARSDIFSLGVVLHESLTGARLFARPTEEQEMRAVLNETAEPPSRANPMVSYAIDKVTLKALSQKRDNRYSNALEFARALESAASGTMWHPEQLGDLVKRLHAERLQQTHSLVQAAQGSTGEHSGLQVRHAEASTKENVLPLLSASPSTRPARHERGITLETPIEVVLSPSPVQPVIPRDEDTTSPHLLGSGPFRAAPTMSMRPRSTPGTTMPRPPPAPTPGEVPFALGPAMPLRGGLPAFRPDGDLHDTGAVPATPSAENLLFADLRHEGKTNPSIDNLPMIVGELDRKTSPSLEHLPRVQLDVEPATRLNIQPRRKIGRLLAIGAGVGRLAVGGVGVVLRPHDPTPVEAPVAIAPVEPAHPVEPPPVTVTAPVTVPIEPPAPVVAPPPPAPVEQPRAHPPKPKPPKPTKGK